MKKPKSPHAATPFRKALEIAILKAVMDAKAGGIVSMSPDTIFQLTRSPGPYLDGAPRGTNARYYYKEEFRNALARLSEKEPLLSFMDDNYRLN